MADKDQLREKLNTLRTKMVTVALDRENLLDKEVQRLSQELDQQILIYMNSCDFGKKEG